MLKLNTIRKKKKMMKRMDDRVVGGGGKAGRRWRVGGGGLDQRKAVERMFNIPTVKKKSQTRMTASVLKHIKGSK